jgi:hypothetical protein
VCICSSCSIFEAFVLLLVLAALVLLVVKLALVLGFVGLGRPAVGVGVDVIPPVLGCFPILECLHERVLVVDDLVLGGAIEA